MYPAVTAMSFDTIPDRKPIIGCNATIAATVSWSHSRRNTWAASNHARNTASTPISVLTHRTAATRVNGEASPSRPFTAAPTA